MSAFRAPTDCLQYHTGAAGTIMNLNSLIRMNDNLNYQICIRKELGNTKSLSHVLETGRHFLSLHSQVQCIFLMLGNFKSNIQHTAQGRCQSWLGFVMTKQQY